MRTTIFLALALLGCLTLTAQKYEFGKVSKAELEMKSDPTFPEADALVLNRHVITIIGDHVEVHERIKILNEEGFGYATVTIPYSDVFKVQGATYNLVDGEVVKTKLDKDLVFTDEVVEGVKIKKFTFPKVEAGSVLDLKYKSSKGTVRDIALQYNIPIKRIKVEVRNFTETRYDVLQNPRAYLFVNRSQTGKTTVISTNDVPALEEEPYVYDIDMFRSKLQIKFLGFQGLLKLDSWESIAGALYEIDDFRKQMEPQRIYRDDLAVVLGDEKSKMKQVELIYDYIKKEIEWDKTYEIIPDHGTRETYKRKKGDVADINMLFISMCRSIGVDAHPILASTRANGIPMTPTIEAFNYLMTGITINDTRYVIDAAHTKSTFDLYPKMLLNWQGLLIREDGSSTWVDLMSAKHSNKDVAANLVIDEDLFISGQARERHTGYYHLDTKAYLKDLAVNEKEEIIEYDFDGFEASEVDIKEDDAKNMTNILFDFEIEDAVDEIDGKLYLSPLVFMAMSENPFLNEERKYPIDFGFPKRNTCMATIVAPEGYSVESMPESLKISLPDNLGAFTYQISENGGKIQIRSQYQINVPVVAFDKYLDLKEFFKVRMEKENEKIVLTKI